MQQENSEIQFQSQRDQNMDSILISDNSKQDQQLDKDCELKDWDSPMCGSCHIQSVPIGVEYQNWRRNLDVYLLFDILLGQIYQKLNYRPVIYKYKLPICKLVLIEFSPSK